MDDQFGGRTDDDLFADEFEPPPTQPIEGASNRQAEPTPAAARQTSLSDDNRDVSPDSTSVEGASKLTGLMQSRHAVGPGAGPPPRPATQTAHTDAPAQTSNHIPKDKKEPSARAAPQSDARTQSGSNPRTKLTHEELESKMEKMRIHNLEASRKFEKAEQDRQQAEQAYVRKTKEERKHQAAEEERRKKDADNRRRMNEERAQNRERKLKAMDAKEDRWVVEETPEDSARSFRGAHGGIRGTRNTGLSGSRFARETGEEDVDRFLSDSARLQGRGRGRGGGGGGGRGMRGARGGFRDGRNGGRDEISPREQPEIPEKAPVISPEEFPALPPSSSGKTGTPVEVQLPPKNQGSSAGGFPLMSPVGKWDDEMEAVEEKKGKRKT